MSSCRTSCRNRSGYLEGFALGLQAARTGGRVPASAGPAAPSGPDAAHLAAMARFEAEGKKLADPEKWKREQHPFDGYARLGEQAARNEYPKPPDNFRWRFYGLFYLAPNQPNYMLRLRMPNSVATWRQFAGIADIAETRKRRLCVHHDAGQHPDPRYRGPQCHDHRRGSPGSRPHLARRGRRQHPQRHRRCHRRHRAGRAARQRGPTRGAGTSTSSMTARSAACRASSTSASTVAARSRRSRRPTTSASPP